MHSSDYAFPCTNARHQQGTSILLHVSPPPVMHFLCRELRIVVNSMQAGHRPAATLAQLLFYFIFVRSEAVTKHSLWDRHSKGKLSKMFIILEHWHNMNVTALAVYLWDDSLKPSTPENDSSMEKTTILFSQNVRSSFTSILFVFPTEMLIWTVVVLLRGFASRRKFNFSFSA